MSRTVILALLSTIAAASAAYAVPSASGPSVKAVDARDRIVCRRFTRVGSLVDGYRTCKTRREWDHEHENIQRLDNPNSCSNPNGNGCEPH